MNGRIGSKGCAALLLLLFTCSSGAVPVVTSGEWVNLQQLDGAVDNESGLGTNEVRWGFPYPGPGGESSGYRFDGVDIDVPIDGTIFALGDFTHLNFPIFLPSITGATLDLTISFTSEGFAETFSFFFEHEETPNTGTCRPAGATECPDVVTIPSAAATEMVTIDGEEFMLSIVGFSRDDGASIVEQFITEEGFENVATLFARFDPVRVVPTPATLAIVGLMLLALGASARRVWR